MRRISTALCAFLMLDNCTPAPPAGARVRIVESKKDLIGGPHALGDLGDYLIENTDARFIIQQAGFSRGFGVFGGGLIDADIQRPLAVGDENGPKGQDNFAEAFPAFFLVAMEPREIYIDGSRRPAMEMIKDAGDGSAAIVVRGRANQFLALTESINNLLVNPGSLLFETTYKLPPTGRTMEIVTRVLNDDPLNNAFFKNVSFSSVKMDVPFGDVLLFGAGNKVFAPSDGGFDLRYRLASHYKENISLPALPGLVVDYLASASDHVSYGFFLPTNEPEKSFVMQHAGAYGSRARPGSMLVPFFASAFTGVFHTQGPSILAPGEDFKFRRYFTVGNGDVASVADEVYRVRGTVHGTLAGRVVDSFTRAPIEKASVVVLDAQGQPLCQANTRGGGEYSMPLPAGTHRVLVRAEGRDLTVPQEFTIQDNLVTGLDLDVAPAARISVQVRDANGAALPSKVTVVGTYAESEMNRDPKDHLFNLSVGEGWRGTDLVPDTLDPSTRRFVEGVFHTANGVVTGVIRPGTYDVYISHGTEYDVDMQRISVAPGGSAELTSTLTHVLDTTGYVSADFHIHSVKSIDSSITEVPRVTSYAAEGVEVMVSTDHNYVTNFSPVISHLGLDPWMRSFVGLELTTLEMGHFNGYPLRYDVTPATHGSFEWSSKTPREVFDALHGMGLLGPSRTIAQVNHPRDTILGYFNQFVWNQDTGVAVGQNDPILGINTENYPNFSPSNFTFNFDAMEVFNGKRFEYLHNYVVPDPLPPPPLPDPTKIHVPAAGQVLRDETNNIAFPGVIDDWFKIIKMGFRHTGVANSDSHMAVSEEAGYPRTYVRSPTDEPAKFSPDNLVDGIKSMDVLMTNGPFITVDVNGAGMGGLASSEAGTVRVKGEVRTAPWVVPGKLIIFENGVKVVEKNIPPDARVFTYDESIPVLTDTFILVEVRDGQSMFPVLTTFDEQPLLINDALTAIGGALGLGGNKYGNLHPATTFIVTPFALTNPVFVDVDGNGAYDPPLAGLQGQAPAALPGPQIPAFPHDVPTSPVGEAQGPLHLWDLISKPVRGQATDIRRIFAAFDHHHGGG